MFQHFLEDYSYGTKRFYMLQALARVRKRGRHEVWIKEMFVWAFSATDCRREMIFDGCWKCCYRWSSFDILLLTTVTNRSPIVITSTASRNQRDSIVIVVVRMGALRKRAVRERLKTKLEGVLPRSDPTFSCHRRRLNRPKLSVAVRLRSVTIMYWIILKTAFW